MSETTEAADVSAVDPPPAPVTSSDGTADLGVGRVGLPSAVAEDAVAADVDLLEADAEPSDRAGRRRARHVVRTRPRRTWLMLLLAVVVLLLLPLLAVVAGRTIANSREGKAVDTTTPVSELPSTPAALLVGLDRNGKPASLTVLSVAAGGKGGTVIVVPLATAAYLDDPAKATRLDSAYAAGGLDAQTQGVESVLGISTTTSQALDEDGLTTLLEPYTPVKVTFDTPVLDTSSDGSTKELFPAGDVTLSAREAAQVLLARVDGESELSRLPRAEALWTALLANSPSTSTGTTTASAPTASTPTVPTGGGNAALDVAGFLSAMAKGQSGVTALRVQPSFDPGDPTAPELLQADVAYLRLLVATVMPGAVSPSNGNISFRIINPLGDPQASYDAVGRLAAVQANVVLVTDTSGPVPDHTSIVWLSPAGQAQAAAFAPVLGAPAPTAGTERIDGVDATVTLGRDFLPFVQAEEAKAAASTTTTSIADTTTTSEAKRSGSSIRRSSSTTTKQKAVP